MNQHVPLTGALIRALMVIRNTNTLLVNGMLSSGPPSVNAAMQYLKYLDHGGIIGGSPQTYRPTKNHGKQATDSGSQSIVKKHRINIFTTPDDTVDSAIWSSSISNFSFTTPSSIFNLIARC